jgi:hypothetical protein
MSVNAFESPVAGNYYHLPFEEIMQTGAMMQGQEDKAKASIALPNDEEKAHQLKGEINKSIYEFQEKHKDTGYRSGSNDLAKLQYEANAKLEEARAHEQRNKEFHTLWDESEKIKNGYQKQEAQYWLNQQAKDPSLGANYNPNTGSFNHVQSAPQYEHKDISKDLQDKLKTINPDKIASDSGYANADEFYRDNTHSEKKYLTAHKIAQALIMQTANDESLKKSAEVETRWGSGNGQPNPNAEQEHNFYGVAQQDEPSLGIKKGDLVPNVNTRIGSEIEGLVLGAQYSQVEHSVAEHNDPMAMKSGEEKKIADNSTLDVSGTTIENIKKDINDKYNRVEYDSKGNIIPRTTSGTKGGTVGAGAYIGAGSPDVITDADKTLAKRQKIELDNRKTDYFEQAKQLITSTNSKDKKAGLALMEKAKAYKGDKDWNDFFKNIETSSSLAYSQDSELSPDAQTFFTKGYGGAELLGRTITDDKGQVMLLSDKLKEMDATKDKDPLDAVKNIEVTRVRNIGVNGNADLAGSFYAILPDGKTKVLIQPSDQQKQIYRPLGDVADFALNGGDNTTGQPIPAGIPNRPSIHMVPKNYIDYTTGAKKTEIEYVYLTPDGQYAPIPQNVVKDLTAKRDDKGNIVREGMEITDIQDLKKYTQDNYKNYLFDVGAVKKTNQVFLGDEENGK